MDLEQTISEVISKCIELIDAGKLEQAKDMLNKIKAVVDTLSVVQAMLSEDSED